MITAVEFIQGGLKQLHGNFEKQLENITPDQLHAVPAGNPKANTIAWGLWHYVRTEDNVVQYILQNKKTLIWVEGGYAAKTGLPEMAQGTGMSTADAQALRIKDLGAFKEYMGKVWAATDALITKNDPALLDRMVTIKPLGEMHAVRALGAVCLTHGMTHFGEIELARTLVGAGAVNAV
jgi:DinB family protein